MGTQKAPKTYNKTDGKENIRNSKKNLSFWSYGQLFTCVSFCFSKNSKFKNYCALTICILVLSADNLCNQFGPSSGPTKVDFEKIRRRQKSMQNYPVRKELKYIFKTYCVLKIHVP